MTETAVADGIALYRVWGEADLLLYIGISDNFGRRWKEHAKRQPWWGEMRRLSVDSWYPYRGDAEDAEQAAIKAERPKYNKTHMKQEDEASSRRSPRRRFIRVDASLTEMDATWPCLKLDIPCLNPWLAECWMLSHPRPCHFKRKTPEQLYEMGVILVSDGREAPAPDISEEAAEDLTLPAVGAQISLFDPAA